MAEKNAPKVEKLVEERVPLQQLGATTLDKPIPEDRQQVHRAVMAREFKRQHGR
jgi:hypothetical protein